MGYLNFEILRPIYSDRIYPFHQTPLSSLHNLL